MNRIFTITLALALQAGAALAHAGLENQAPADGATVEAPQVLLITFSEPVTLAFTGITLSGADGAAVTLGEASLDPDGGTILTVPVPVPLSPGKYAVEWHALSDDGHRSHGSYSFTVK
jgi:copper resistance protein C